MQSLDTRYPKLRCLVRQADNRGTPTYGQPFHNPDKGRVADDTSRTSVFHFPPDFTGLGKAW
jgi:hypothetical protein